MDRENISSEVDRIWESEKRREQASNFHNALANENRVTTLIGIAAFKSPLDIAEELDTHRSVVHSHLETLEDAEMIYRPSGKSPLYVTTPLGDDWVQTGETSLEDVFQVYDLLEEYGERWGQEYGERLRKIEQSGEDYGTAEDIFGEGTNRHTWKWENAWDEAKQILEVDEMSYEP